MKENILSPNAEMSINNNVRSIGRGMLYSGLAGMVASTLTFIGSSINTIYPAIQQGYSEFYYDPQTIGHSTIAFLTSLFFADVGRTLYKR